MIIIIITMITIMITTPPATGLNQNDYGNRGCQIILN